MKKILAILLVCLFAVSCVACGGTEESSVADTSSKAESTADTESSTADTSVEASKEESTEASEEASEQVSEDETSEEASEEVSEEPSEDDTVSVTYTNKFVSWAIATGNGARVSVRADDATSLKLSKVNEAVNEGDTGVFTYEFGKTIKVAGQDYADFAVIVAEYDHETFSYKRTEVYEVGKAPNNVSIPKDGFVIVIWKDLTDKITAITDTVNPLFPHGFVANTGLDAKISAAKTAPTIDGKADSKEYGKAIWSVTPENELMSYAQFEKNNYFATAEVFMTYDKEHVYLAVVVDSPIHDNVKTPDTASGMYDQTCIQVNFGVHGRDSDYIDEHWDWQIDKTSTTENMMRQYGFGLNPETGDQLTVVWQGDSTRVCDTFCVTRVGEITTYEVALKWSDLGSADAPFAPKKGDEFQLAVSFNLGGKTVGDFKNITLRDGGGIIGINDWTKIPTITLG